MDLLLHSIRAIFRAANSLPASGARSLSGDKQLLLSPANAEAIAALVDLTVSEVSTLTHGSPKVPWHEGERCKQTRLNPTTAAGHLHGLYPPGGLESPHLLLLMSLVYIAQVRGLLGHSSHEAQTNSDLAKRARTVLKEAEAACSPAPALPRRSSSSLAGGPEDPAGPSTDQALPAWRSHGLTALLRSLQSEFEAAEQALAAALEQQACGLLRGHGESENWSICAMRESASVDKYDTELGPTQALAELSQCLEGTCETTR